MAWDATRPCPNGSGTSSTHRTRRSTRTWPGSGRITATSADGPKRTSTNTGWTSTSSSTKPVPPGRRNRVPIRRVGFRRCTAEQSLQRSFRWPCSWTPFVRTERTAAQPKRSKFNYCSPPPTSRVVHPTILGLSPVSCNAVVVIFVLFTCILSWTTRKFVRIVCALRATNICIEVMSNVFTVCATRDRNIYYVNRKTYALVILFRFRARFLPSARHVGSRRVYRRTLVSNRVVGLHVWRLLNETWKHVYKEKSIV